MRYRDPIIQEDLTADEAEEVRARYLQLNPMAMVTVERQLNDPRLKTVIAHLPWLPASKVREPGFIGYRGWRC
jgi:hypothetical protein